jgi:cell division transport system ATP-binding protein
MTDKQIPLIEIENLTRWYPWNPSLIFKKFNFKLYPNDFAFILWKSWVWKTTLVKFLIRQLKPPRKTIFFNKEDISRFSDKEVQRYRRQIWVIFQDFKLIDWKTVEENVSYPLEILWVSRKKIKEKVNQLLYKLDLMDKKDEKIPNLSWWEKQRVAIARALINAPKFIIADEPTGNLDWETSKKIADILINLNLQWNTILFITHDLALVDYVKQKHKAAKVVEIK